MILIPIFVATRVVDRAGSTLLQLYQRLILNSGARLEAALRKELNLP